MAKQAIKKSGPETQKKTEVFVFDACAIIAYFNDESGAVKVEHLIEKARAGDVQLYTTSVNVYEVYYDALRRNESEMAKEFLDDIYGWPITILESIDRSMMQLAGHFKLHHKMSLADSLCLGLAKQLDAKVVTTDHHEFDAVAEAEGVKIYWLR